MTPPKKSIASSSDLIQARKPYLDTLKVYVDRFVDDAEQATLLTLAGSIWKLGPMPHQAWWKCGLVIHQPSTEILHYVATAFDNHVVSRFDAALDLITDTSSDAFRLAAFIEEHLVQRRRSRGRVARYKSTVYYSRAGSRNNIVLYADKESKVAANLPCAHLEWRICSADAVRNAGINSVADLLTFDHRKFWRERLVLRGHPAYEDLERLGKAICGQPKRRKPWQNHFGPGLQMNRFVRVGSTYLRAASSKEHMTVQEALDLHGAKWARYYPELPVDWLLPPESP